MKLFVIGLLISCTFSNIKTEEVRLVELEPDQAAQYINQQDQSLRYAPKVESNVPGVRFIGNHPEQVVEDIYLANQYHGQDGLGAYVYGYSVPDIAKTEKKERSGDLKGAYNYIAGNGQEIKVQYWDDGTGFHQIDNVPREQPEDNPEVKAAKEEHLRIWHEQALRNSQAPADPNENYYNQPAQPQPIPNQYQQYGQAQAYGTQPQPSQPLVQYAPQPSQPQPYNQGYQPSPASANSVEYTGQYSNNQQTFAQPNAAGNSANGIDLGRGPAVEGGVWAESSNVNANRQPYGQVSAKQNEEEDVTGPPKGFFYSFDYPVGIIVGKEGQNLEAAYSQNKELFEKQLKGEAPRPSGSSNSYVAATA